MPASLAAAAAPTAKSSKPRHQPAAAPASELTGLRALPMQASIGARLMRAIVTLPLHMQERGNALEERVVFFEQPMRTLKSDEGKHLAGLLAAAWCTDTSTWTEDGTIYNLRSAFALHEEGMSADPALRVLEMGWGGPERIDYVLPEDAVLLVSPRVRTRLDAALRAAHSGPTVVRSDA